MYSLSENTQLKDFKDYAFTSDIYKAYFKEEYEKLKKIYDNIPDNKLDNGIAAVIGTSVGNNPTGATTYAPFKLPKTEARVSIAATFLERPDKNAGTIQIPDYRIEYSINDLLQGVDPFFEKAVELIKNDKP